MLSCSWVCSHALRYALMLLGMLSCSSVCSHALGYALMLLGMLSCSYVCSHALRYALMLLATPVSGDDSTRWLDGSRRGMSNNTLNHVRLISIEDLLKHPKLAPKMSMQSRVVKDGDVMAGLKRASHTGANMVDAEGKVINVWPSMYAHVTDYPKSCKVTYTKSGTTLFPCSLCKVPKEKLSKLTDRIDARTPSEQCVVVKAVATKTIKDDSDESLSTHPVQVWCTLDGGFGFIHRVVFGVCTSGRAHRGKSDRIEVQSTPVVHSEEQRLRLQAIAPMLGAKKTYDTAMIKAQRTGVRVLSRRSWLLHVPRGRVAAPFCIPNAPQANRDAMLEKEIGADLKHLRTALNAASGCNNKGEDIKSIQVHWEMAMPAVDAQYSRLPHRVRALPRHHGRPWYSDVAVKGETEDGHEEWYAKVLLLFHCKVDRMTKEYAYVKYYDVLPALDSCTNCKRLKWPPLVARYQQHNLEFLADATTGALAEDFSTDNRSAFDKELDEGLDEEQDEEQEEDDEEDSEDEAGAEQHQQQLAQQQQQLGVEKNGAVRGTRSEGINAYWVRQNRGLQAHVEDLKATVDILQISQAEAQQKLAAAKADCEILRSRLGELEAQQAGGVTEMSSDGPHVNPANLTRDNNGNVIVKTSLEKKEFAVKALDTFTWLITDAQVECMEFFPTFEVFQPHLITKYRLCGVNRDEYFYATGGRIEFEKLVMKGIKTKRSNTHKKVRFYAWGAGGLVDESKWPLLAVELIIPSKKRMEEKWLEDFRHAVLGYAWHINGEGIPFANIAFEKAALAAFSVVTSTLVYVKIPMLAYLCVVVEAPLESYRLGNGQPSLGGVPLTNSNLVRAKTIIVVAALHAAMVNNPTFLKHDEGLDTCAIKACGVNGKCIKDSAGVASCVCDAGFVLHADKKTCTDTCVLKKCGGKSKCVKSAAGVASCACDTGFALQPDGVTCTDTCTLKACGNNGKCTKDSAGVASCVCDTGFVLQADGTTCTDTCVVKGCGGNGTCSKNVAGLASSVCNAGFVLQADGIACTDTCTLKACGVNGKCSKDSAGVASCVCNTGFVLQADGTTCTDTCVIKSCDANANCVKDAQGVASCVWKTGFQMVGGTCTGTCVIKSCDANANCVKGAQGVASCVCKMGFQMVGGTCTVNLSLSSSSPLPSLPPSFPPSDPPSVPPSVPPSLRPSLLPSLLHSLVHSLLSSLLSSSLHFLHSFPLKRRCLPLPVFLLYTSVLTLLVCTTPLTLPFITLSLVTSFCTILPHFLHSSLPSPPLLLLPPRHLHGQEL
ncbi:unnamed protein product [Closterium sp. Yama58-4]|nr:unnamed protein product [Closterium sp. Yama58-4]